MHPTSNIKKKSIMNQISLIRFGNKYLHLLLIIFFTQISNAQTITMPNIIGSNMVLQQNTQVPLWGWATAGTNVVVEASWGQSVTATTSTNGKWMTKIQTPVAVSGQAPTYTITITGPANTISFTNILVGEVWLCSGQSNMWFPMQSNGGDMKGVIDYVNEIAAANFPNIRLYTVPLASATSPADNCGGSWLSCSPTTVASFSAAAYYFGRELYNTSAVNVPIGLIHSSYYGSAIQTWIKDSVLRADASLKTKYIDGIAPTAAVTTQPSRMYNAMIAPLIPFAIKGAIWYQGEANGWDGANYGKANIALIKDWRASWGTELSFYATQLAPRLLTATTKDIEPNHGFFSEHQSAILTLPKTGIIVTQDLLLDATERQTSHPRDKRSVGKRLAYWALAKDYGQPVQYLGPKFLSSTIVGDKVRISFTPESLGSGLKTKDGSSQVSCFIITGTDKAYYYRAIATIEGNTVVVSSPYVTNPLSVRYAFTDGAMTNLVNNEGIGAYPFRLDSWSQYPAIPFFDMAEPTTGIENNQLETVRFFPNPFHDLISLSGVDSEIKKIELYDVTGRCVKSEIINSKFNCTVDVSNIAKGAYIIRILKKNMTSVDFKAIKQ